MARRSHRVFKKGIWSIRLYALILALMLAVSLTMLLTQTPGSADRQRDEERCCVSILYHGQTTMAASSGETVGQLLQRLDLEVTGEDVVSHGMDEPVVRGMELRIDRMVTAEEHDTSVVPHSVTRCGDPRLPEGQERILHPRRRRRATLYRK